VGREFPRTRGGTGRRKEKRERRQEPQIDRLWLLTSFFFWFFFSFLLFFFLLYFSLFIWIAISIPKA
jgi:hypothetical protein